MSTLETTIVEYVLNNWRFLLFPRSTSIPEIQSHLHMLCSLKGNVTVLVVLLNVHYSGEILYTCI